MDEWLNFFELSAEAVDKPDEVATIISLLYFIHGQIGKPKIDVFNQNRQDM